MYRQKSQINALHNFDCLSNGKQIVNKSVKLGKNLFHLNDRY